jgi:Family of unknown function (DUF5719)/FtsX extracellular domain
MHAMRGRRIPIVVVLIGLLAAAVASGDRRVRADAGVREPAVAASMPATGVRSSAWFCAGGPTGRGPSGDQVAISNGGSGAVRVAIDVLIAGRDATEQLVTVSPRSTTTLPVARLSRAPAAAVVVQPLGGAVVVEQGFAVNGDVAMAPCATRGSSNWYFAAGSSVGGAQTWLSLMNPFSVDAVVDVEADSENGFRAPGSLQGLVVPRNSRLAVRIDQTVAEQRAVAVAVRARNGSRVVATQSVIQPGSGAKRSVSLSVGALAPSRTWMFADNRSRAGAVQRLVLADPEDVDATARVSIVADVAAVIEPQVVHIPATSAVTVDFSGVVPAGVTYTLVVRSVVPVVAETRDLYVDEFRGIVTEVGSTAAARRWSFSGGPFTATGSGGDRPRVAAGFDLAIVMDVGATAGQIRSVYTALVHNGHVARFRSVTRAAALANLLARERDNPSLARSMTSAMMPASFDVSARSDSLISVLRQYFGARAGVDSVVTAATEGPQFDDDVVVLNPGTRPVRVSVTATAGGSSPSAPGTTDVEIAPGRQATISLVSLKSSGAAASVSATGPVVAERLSAGPWGVTRSPGVPWLLG